MNVAERLARIEDELAVFREGLSVRDEAPDSVRRATARIHEILFDPSLAVTGIRETLASPAPHSPPGSGATTAARPLAISVNTGWKRLSLSFNMTISPSPTLPSMSDTSITALSPASLSG
jgi:hypothetical protein